VSSVSTYTVLGVGWYVDNDLQDDRKIFSRFQDQEGGLLAEFGDDVNYPVKGLCSIYFQMLLR
jgi:hypothetical protein